MQTNQGEAQSPLTIDVGAVLSQELQGVWVVVLHGLRNIDDVHTSAMVPAWARAQGLSHIATTLPQGQAQGPKAHCCLPVSCLKLSILRATEDTNNVTKVDKEKSHCD